MNAASIYGTDNGPEHTCGSTVYRYDAKAFKVTHTMFSDESSEVYTVFATCCGCNRNAGMFRLESLPESAEEMRKCHQVVGVK